MILMRMEGIPGDVLVPGFQQDESWFRINHFQFGIRRESADAAAPVPPTLAATAGQPTQCSLAKPTNAASFMLARRSLSGDACREAEIKFLESIDIRGHAHNVVYLWFRLETVYVTTWNVECDAADRPLEKVRLSFERIGFAHWATGNGETFFKTGECNWDHAAGKPWKASGLEIFPKDVEMHPGD